MITDIIARLEPALLALLQMLIAAVIAQVALYLRRKHKILQTEHIESIVHGLVQDAVAYAEQIGRQRTSPSGPFKLETALLYANRQSKMRGLGRVDVDDMRDRIETVVGHQNAAAIVMGERTA